MENKDYHSGFHDLSIPTVIYKTAFLIFKQGGYYGWLICFVVFSRNLN